MISHRSSIDSTCCTFGESLLTSLHASFPSFRAVFAFKDLLFPIFDNGTEVTEFTDLLTVLGKILQVVLAGFPFLLVTEQV